MTLRLPGESDGEFLDRIDAAWWMRRKNAAPNTVQWLGPAPVADEAPEVGTSLPDHPGPSGPSMALDLERRFAACIWLMIVAVALLMLAGCDDRPCLRSHTEQQLYYPYAGLIALGGTYVALSMMPSYRTITVCDEYGEVPDGVRQAS
jgi:hypothetical protein